MKKFTTMLLCLLLCLTTGAALAQIEIDGTIEPERMLSLLAPYSGRVGDMDLRAGDVIAAGETLFTLSTKKVYADFDGVVTGVFAQPGDSAASVQNRYGALMYMEGESLYRADCTTNGSHSDNENKIVHVGETVYIQSTEDRKREGVAIVTGVADKNYTLEVILDDGLRVNDSVRVYRDNDHETDTCIGTGRISRINPTAVTSDGHVLAVHVQDGQAVSRGDLLLETVPDALDGMMGGDGSVALEQDAVLLNVLVSAGNQVSKDQVLATYCPAGEMKLVCSVDEEDLAFLETGDEMTVTFDALGETQIRATVDSIAAAADENGEFAVTLTLEKTDGVRIGMSATAEK